MKPGRKEQPALERFNRYWLGDPNSGCWLWTGALDKDGYGLFWMGGRKTPAHRASHQLFISSIPAGLVVRHKCDTPTCVNPDHLIMGTPADNSQDCVSRNRWPRQDGDFNGAAKLSREEVWLIRELSAAGLPGKVLAQKFRVSKSLISQIINGNRWKDRTDADTTSA